MFEFYLTIMDSIVKSRKHPYLAKFNNMVYGDCKLSSDEKLYLFGEIQKRWQKACERSEPLKDNLNV